LDPLISAPVCASVPPPLWNAQVEDEGMEKVGLNEPVKATSPPRVSVNPVLATPVPPYWPASTEPFQVPPVMVPMALRGSSAEVSEHGANEVALPQVPMT
jgi:hypothetical protein